MSDTPITDAFLVAYEIIPEPKALMMFCRNIELKLHESNEYIKRLEKDYFDLIMQVERKFDGETRHETAKRYIKNAEQLTTESKESKP
jgi:hypothetical protein